ncbi:MAG: hypothetical protein GEU80_10740 [Dehalococcoidia bacterium]|nr:hypothetical protein [Dehalococcoidia bacterium]
MARLIVDAMNVIGSRPTGWWRDRAGAHRRLLEQLAALASESGDEVTAVLEGRTYEGIEAGERDGVRVLYSDRHGPDAADDRIVDLVAEDPDSTTLTVVTSDRRLAERVGLLGAEIQGASWLLRRLR